MNKRGSTSIFLIFILAGIIALTALFIYAAKQAAAFSYGDGLLNLAGKSILSEFDRKLKDTYGFFAFEASGSSMKTDLSDYTAFSLAGNDSAKIKNIQVDAGNYSLVNMEIVKKQILEYMKFAAATNLFEKEEAAEKALEEKKEKKDRTLRNHKIIDMLPSVSLCSDSPEFVQWAGNAAENFETLEGLFNSTSDICLLNRYILEHFKHVGHALINKRTFFENEVEYILAGNYSNKANRDAVHEGLVLMRSNLNAAYLERDSEKQESMREAAETLASDEAEAVTQTALSETWAQAEAENDVALLEKGKPVPFLKDKDTWATKLDKVLSNKKKGCIDTGNSTGLYYEDYLMIFLTAQNETVKLARMMDLIQINMKGTYDRNFLLRLYSCGFLLNAEINQKEQTYDFKY